MTYDITVPYSGGDTPYAKPVPAGSTPNDSPWAGDIRGVTSTAGGAVTFTGLADGMPYWIYVTPFGVSPSNIDPLLAVISAPSMGDITALADLLEADQVLIDEGGVQKLKTYKRGTSTELIPAKTAKQPSGVNLTDPQTQLLGGYRE